MFELIYTSYPRGLKTGTSGFTPVAYTQGIPKNYIHICESLSGYPFIYPLGHPLYDQNPEIYTHYRFKLKGRTNTLNSEKEMEEISILSRIASAGKDYTGRENKIAHHIILDSKEREFLLEGPAWIMLYADLFIERWDKTPCFLTPKNIQNIYQTSIQHSKFEFLNQNQISIQHSKIEFLNQNQNKTESLNVWESVFGSSEPAHILSQSAENNNTVPSFMLFNLNNMDNYNAVLDSIIKNNKIEQTKEQDKNKSASVYLKKINLFLIYEALNLISLNKKWDITFNTYFVSNPIDSNALWRFCPCPIGDNSQYSSIVSNYAQKYPYSIVIDIEGKAVYRKENLNLFKKDNISKENKTSNSSESIYTALKDNRDIKPDKIDEAEESPLDISTYKTGVSEYNRDTRTNIDTSTAGGIDLLKAEILETERLREALKRGNYFILLLIITAICFGFIYILFIQDIHINKNDFNNSSIKAEDITAVQNIKIENSSTAKANNNNAAKIENNNAVKIMTFSFYDSAHNKFSIDENNFKNIKFSIIKNNGIETDAYLEKPITADTPNWDIVSKTSQQPLGYIKKTVDSISVENINLYNKNLYSAIYLDIPLKEHREFIWLNQINISRSMIFKGSESNTLEIRFPSEMSKLLQDFLIFLSPDGLAAAAGLKSYKENNNAENEGTKENNDVENEGTRDKNNINDNNKSGSDNEILPNYQTEQENTLLTYPQCAIKRDEKTNETYIQMKFSDDDFQLIMKNSDTSLKDTKKSLDVNINKFDTVSNIQSINIEYKDKPGSKTYSILSFINSKPAI